MEMVRYVGKKRRSLCFDIPHLQPPLHGASLRVRRPVLEKFQYLRRYNRETRETRRCTTLLLQSRLSKATKFQGRDKSWLSGRLPMVQTPSVTNFLRFRWFRSNGNIKHISVIAAERRKNAKNNNGDNNSVTTLNLLNMTWTRANVGRLRASTSCSL